MAAKRLSEIERLRVELGQINALYADRERDLEFEFQRANTAEVEVERLRDLCREYRDDNEAQARTIGDLRAEVARLRATLAEVEWIFNETGDFEGSDFCPWCNGCEKFGHMSDCQRQLALGLQP